MGLHGRGNLREGPGKFGEVFFHVGHNARAGGGEEESGIGVGKGLRQGFAHRLGAEGRLPHAGKAQALQGGHQAGGIQAGELAGPRGGHGGVHSPPGGDHGLHPGEIQAGFNRLDGAGFHAQAAGHAQLRNDRRLPPLDADRLHRAFPDAPVAPLAFRTKGHHVLGDHAVSHEHPPLPRIP